MEMEQKKYEFTGETMDFFGRTLHRIRSLRAFSDINIGDIGGWIEKEENLSHNNNAQVFDDAQVSGKAQVFGEAQVGGKAQVGGEARVYNKAQVFDDALVSGKAQVYGKARVCGEARIFSNHHYWTSPRIGSRNDITTFYRSKDRRIMVVCGCCHTDIEDFARRVKETHGDNQHARDYERAIQMAKIWIDLEGDIDE